MSSLKNGGITIGLRGGINTYVYVSGNPIGSIDPLGLCDECKGDFVGPPNIVPLGVEPTSGAPYWRNLFVVGMIGPGGESAKLTKEFVALTAKEISAINRRFGGVTALTGEVETVLSNMAYREGVYEKFAVTIRDIAGRHLFNDGNERTAQEVVEQLARLNGVSINADRIRSVIDQVAQGSMRSIEEIACALSGKIK